MKPKQIDLHAEEDMKYRQSSKYFCSPQSSAVCANRKNSNGLISPLLLLQMKMCLLLALLLKELEVEAAFYHVT